MEGASSIRQGGEDETVGDEVDERYLVGFYVYLFLYIYTHVFKGSGVVKTSSSCKLIVRF